MNLTGTSTYLDRRNSAQFFPRKSTPQVLVAPRSNRFLNRKCTPLRLGNSNRSISILGTREVSYSLPKRTLIVSIERRFFNHTNSSSCRTQKPQLQSDPLSPERALTIVPRGTRSVDPNFPRSTCKDVLGWLAAVFRGGLVV